MAINAAKQLLDELMGRERNLAADDKTSSLNWNDQQVCRHFLVKFCPNGLFTNTRADIGPCPLVHDDFLKREYDKKARRKDKMIFEDEFIRFCQSQLNEVERKIKRAKQRLEMSQLERNSGLNATTAVLSEESQEKMKVLTERIDTLLEQIEKLGCEGKVEEAQGIMKLVDQLKEEKSGIKREAMPNNHWIQQKAEIGAQQEKQMEVCDVCGAFLIVNDVQQRVDDHLMGKQHMGYGLLKTALDEILERRRQERDREKQEAENEAAARERARDERRQRDRSPRDNRDRDRDRERDRDRDRDRERRRDSEPDRQRDRDSRRHSERSDRNERDRHSDRDKDRHRRRSRSPRNTADIDREHHRSSSDSKRSTKESGSSPVAAK
ncbi:luc7-like protein 3 isoform X2 [Oppia nitens]|uniref:luc7-like protein 3 isoform X2 n=1 Tax=Oppia nitens TaxID=1686743 RepID=UPI0023DC3880|nr:luc7-like protein 3 isoform X2 [Oppia nitens]